MATDIERLIGLLEAIGLDEGAAQKRAGQLRVLQRRGDALGVDAVRLLEAMANQVGDDTATFEAFDHDTDTLSPAELLSAIEEAVAQKSNQGSGDPKSGDPKSEDQISTAGMEPTLPQLGEPPESGSEEDKGLTLHAGERVDQYEVIRAIGQGGMGAVYLARDVLLGRKVALKLVHPHLVASAGSVERFLFEARATARFNHPNIVTIYGLGQVRGCPYVALEYLPGVSVRTRLKDGKLPAGETLEIARRVAVALAEAHRQSILHCDLKPENIFLPRDGRLRVLDFGLAKLVQRPLIPSLEQRSGELNPDGEGAALQGQELTADERQRKEQQSALRGTAPYMAPEQWKHGELGPATDIWAFGVTLYEILTGTRPFGGSPVAIYEQVTDETRSVPSPRKVDPTIPRPLAGLCERCLRRDPQTRPSAADLADLLTKLIHERDRKRGDGDEDQSPFRGLMPFRKAHADLFFGRDTEIAAFVERLREVALVAVVGPSGAGKSSFVQAGVLPRLESLGPWESLVLRPGSNPLLALAGRLQQDPVSTESASGAPDPDPDMSLVQNRRDLAERLLQEPALLGRLLRERARRNQGRIILVMDQFEELFTLVDEPQVREVVCKALLYAGDDPDGAVRVVLTLRDDFLGRLAVVPEFVSEVSRGIVVIRTPNAEALDETLTQPLARVGYRFADEKMVGEMVAEVAHEQAGLPLLQFAAQRLWEGRDRDAKVLRRTTYESIGGVAGALADHADQVLGGLMGDAARAAREVLISLVTRSSTRATVQEQLLIKQVGAGAEEAVAHLVASRLVVSRRALVGDTAVSLLELVHESLITRWEQLRRWREESLDDVNLQADLQAALEQWKRRGRRAEDLWRGLSLAEAIDWRERTQSPHSGELDQFISRSANEAQVQSSRLARLRFGLLGGLLLFTVTAAAFVWVRIKERRASQARNEAVAARKSARLRLSLALLEGAQAARLRQDFAEARAKLRTSFEVADSAGARSLYAALERQPLKFRATHPESVFSVATAPDGRQVATGCYDGTIRLWDWATGTVRVLRGHRKEVFSLAFGPQGRLLASGAGDGNVRIWSLATGKSRVLSGHLDRVHGVAFDSTGDRVASAAGDGTIKVWTLSRKNALTLKGHQGRVNAVSFSASGRLLYSGGEDKTVRVWNLRRQSNRVLLGHTDSVAAVASGPSDGQIASAGEDGTVRVWNPDTGKARVLRGHRGEVTSLAFDLLGRRLASGSTDRTIRLWDLKSGRSRVLGTHDARVSSLGFSGTGDLLASGSYDRTMRLWDLRTPPPRLASGHSGWVSGVAFRPDGAEVASASQDRTIRLWNVQTGHSRTLEGHTARVIAVAYRPDGRELASAAWDKTVRVWDLASGKARVLRGHTSRIYGLDYSPDGRTVASGSWDRTIRVWDLQSGRAKVLRGHTNRVFGVAFSPDGKHLASAAWDKTVRIWDLATGKARVLAGHEHRVSAVAYAPNGEFVASASYDKTVRIWNLTTGKARVLRGHTDFLWGVAVSPDSRFVASASRDRQIRVWDLQTGKLRAILAGHTMDVNRVAFSPGGALLASGSDDTTVRLWNLATGSGHWRAPLLLGKPEPRLFTGRGLVVPAGFGHPGTPLGRTTGPAETRLVSAVRRTRRPVHPSHDGRLLTIIPEADRVTLWDIARGRGRWTVDWKGIDTALPLGDGVAGLARGTVSLATGGHGKRRVLVPSGAGLITLSGTRLLVATSRRLHIFDGRARPLRQFPVDPGVTAALLTDDHVVLGYRDGTVELMVRKGKAKRLGHPFESTPSRPVTRLAEGPLSTLAVGFADGTVGLWNLRNGKLLQRHRLHGEVRHLARLGHQLYAATDLADTARLDLTVFHQRDCDLMRRIWSRFGATWDRGRATRRPPPGNHRCLKRPSR
jgi:WD40 repeat protein/serine/threonine protein kinase